MTRLRVAMAASGGARLAHPRWPNSAVLAGCRRLAAKLDDRRRRVKSSDDPLRGPKRLACRRRRRLVSLPVFTFCLEPRARQKAIRRKDITTAERFESARWRRSTVERPTPVA